jgi:hypothetical protein
LRNDTGEEIAVVEENAVATGTDEVAGGRDAILAAGRLAGEALSRHLAESWRKVREPHEVEIRVTGTQNLSAFVRLRQGIVTTPGVNALQVREIQPREARIVVDFASDAQELAAALMVRDFTGFGVKMTGIEANRMTIELVPAP